MGFKLATGKDSDNSVDLESSKSLSDTSEVPKLNQQLNSPNVTPLMTPLVTSPVTQMVTTRSVMKTTAPQVAPIPDKILDELKPVDNFLIGKASTHSTTPKSTVPPTTPPPTTITTINHTIKQNNTSTEIEPPSKTPRKDFDFYGCFCYLPLSMSHLV